MARQSDVLQAPPLAVVPQPPLPAPSELTEEQQGFWRGICEHGRFHPDCKPVLTELVRHMSYSAMVASMLDAMRDADLVRSDKRRAVYAELLKMHLEQSKRIASLCTKLRMTAQSQIELRRAEAARRSAPTTAPPWQRGEQ